ncbi:protein translocase subunit SecD, partial [Candidatus Roizmanbacteria bacterium]|nr:protein translocase subunit SecD [Candidatus Roizmanbacteria bacterium]
MKGLLYLLVLILLAAIIWIDFPQDKKIGQKEIKTHLGLDLQGGSHLLFEADISKLSPQDREEALNSAKDIIERRVNFFGVSEPTVQTITAGKTYRISVDLPGITNTDEAIQLIGQTAQLEFVEEATGDAQLATAPALLRLTKRTGLTGKDVKKAGVSFDNQTGEPQVGLSFSSEGTKKFAAITSRNVGKQVGIFIDNFPISAPVVEQPIIGGDAVIRGKFTIDEAKKLAIAINSGALPVPIKLIEQRNIGPTLGAIEVKKSVYAGIVGLIMVMLFMILYYKKLGLVACIALIIYGLLSLAIFKSIPIVLTLPGVAGFILSIGMAVDANILIFERIKEELRKGRDFDIALRLGFGRAIDAIKDANITTLLVAFILFNPLNWNFLPQSGLVRGFALTLAIGVLMSLFTGIFITRRLIRLVYK